MPMQPSPRAETSRLFPSLRFCIFSTPVFLSSGWKRPGSLFSFTQDIDGRPDCRDRTRPSSVESKMREELDQFVLADPVFAGTLNMRWQLVDPVQRDESGDGNQAAVTLGQARALPHIPEQHVVGQFHQ